MPGHAIYEWNYQRQLLAIRAAAEAGETGRACRRAHLLRRLPAGPPPAGGDPPTRAPVLLIDEIDRADEEFEAYLLEILSDFQITDPRAWHHPAPRPAHRDPDRRTARATCRMRCAGAASTPLSTIPTARRKSPSCGPHHPGMEAALSRADRRLRPGVAEGRPGKEARRGRDAGFRRGTRGPWRQRPDRRPGVLARQPCHAAQDPERPRGRCRPKSPSAWRERPRDGPRVKPVTRFPQRAAGPADRMAGFMAHLRLNGLAGRGGGNRKGACRALRPCGPPMLARRGWPSRPS